MHRSVHAHVCAYTHVISDKAAALQVFAYGSMLATLGVAVCATATAHYYGVTSLSDVKAGFQRSAQSWREPLGETLAPLKGALCAWVGRNPADLEYAVDAQPRALVRAGPPAEESEFRRLLKQRFKQNGAKPSQ